MKRALLIVALIAYAGSAGAAPCVAATEPLPAGHFVQPGDFAPAPCAAAALAGHVYRYDAASGALRLTRPLAAGEVTTPPQNFGVSRVVPGQPLRLLLISGSVRIEREVVALQTARFGESLFVRDRDGQIFSIRYQAGAQ